MILSENRAITLNSVVRLRFEPYSVMTFDRLQEFGPVTSRNAEVATNLRVGINAQFPLQSG